MDDSKWITTLKRTKAPTPELRTFRDRPIVWKGDGIYEMDPVLDTWFRLWSIAFVEIAGKYGHEFLYISFKDTQIGDDEEMIRKLMED